MESRDDEQRRCEKLTDDMNVIRAYITLATSSEKRRSLELQLLQSEREVANARENLEKMNKSVAQEMRNWGLRDVERALKADMHKHAIANVSSLKQANAQCESLLETLEALG
ncbi:hypothetical protein SARC_07405 [Sphaeroforma arctica JP610]|uniref:Uncharacterized protein n=1 Tax=Sphaeroforma arctica JP610 TaxID=667725 RepID=A0A0L0FWA5_9EUKA|nr:hypothetical protein SARC_07405 [Sphaeroforma arctica JP610]KNC80233.1 hypothetical protein SARC_07405 [Sphaeroforma arctica JP610]|eukprot:XP_014154135.1 hypothetical protein SARC_07405 [Sphaeroforma arctica JP610]